MDCSYDEMMNCFVADGVYTLNMISDDDIIFVCTPSTGSTIGKLVQYKWNGNLYAKTGVSYFLNRYNSDDIKSVFLKRENYEIIGSLCQNFVMSDDEEYILKG